MTKSNSAVMGWRGRVFAAGGLFFVAVFVTFIVSLIAADIFYIDKETFNFYHIENYDQKGRLYRTVDLNYGFFPEMGAITWSGMINLMRDHLDLHSACFQSYQLPAFWSRRDVSLKGLLRKAK